MGSIFGKLSSGLTKTGVQGPDGSQKFYDNPAAAGLALASAARQSVAPSTSYVDGTIGAPVIAPGSSFDEVNGTFDPGSVSRGTDVTKTGTINPPVVPQATMTHPTFADAQDHPEELTTKGKVLSLLLTAGMGAARGAAAAVPTNPHISPGLGPSLEAGFQTPFVMAQQRNDLANEALRQQRERTEISAIPIHQKQQQALIDSEISKNNAAADRKDVFQTAGGGLYQRMPDGTVRAIKEPNTAPTLSDQIAARQQYIEDAEATARAQGKPAPFTAMQRALYIAGQKYDPKNDPDSAEFKETARVANQRSANQRYSADQRANGKLKIRGGAKDPFAQFGGRSF